MAMEEALVARLKACAPIAALVGTRISFFELPRKGALPSILMTTIWPGRNWTQDAPDKLSEPRVQFDCWGRSRTQAAAVKDALQAELERTDPVSADGVTWVAPAMIQLTLQTMEDLAGTEGVYRWQVDFLMTLKED